MNGISRNFHLVLPHVSHQGVWDCMGRWDVLLK